MKATLRRAPGPAAAPRRIPFCVPSTDQTEIDQVNEAIRSGWLTTGPKVKEFEEKIARFVGAEHAVAVNSCTAAQHIALAALGIGRGHEVITSPYTFAATGETILYTGAKPVFVDIDPVTLNISPDAVRRAITRRTRAIEPVHMAGLACDMDALEEIARKRRIPIVEDAAHAIGSTCGRRRIGAISDITCFSFYATKNLTTGEGGMLTTQDGDLAARLRRLSLHGLSRDAWKRYTAAGTWKYDIVELGYKYNMTDVAAGIGLAQLAKFKTMQARRRMLARRYTRLLSAVDAFDLPPERKGWTHAWHLYILRLRPKMLRIGRDQVIEELRDRGIGTSVHFIPLHLHSLYRKQLRHPRGSFPNAEREWARAISLPLFPGLSLEDQDRVVEALVDIAARHRR